MAGEDTFEVTGTVIHCDRGGFYRVRLDNDHEVLARLSGRMYLSSIRILEGDRVRIEMNGYSLDRGRIVWRDKAPSQAPTDMYIGHDARL
jgi:translation initiation factor IF-1